MEAVATGCEGEEVSVVDRLPGGTAERRGRPVAAVAALALLLALIAMAGGARRGSSTGSVHPLGLRIVADVVATVAALIAIVGIAGWVGIVVAQRRRRRAQGEVRLPPRLPPFWERLLGIVLPFALAALGLGVVIGGRLAGWWDQDPPGPDPGAGLAGRRLPPTETPIGIDWPLVAVVVALVLAGAGALSLAGRRGERRRRSRGPSILRGARELEALRTVGLDELASEPDPRRAVIRAYAAMCQLLASSGRPRRPSEAPFEFLARVLQDLGASADAAARLTELFERAQFSVHPITPAFRDEAVAAVRGLRVEVETNEMETSDARDASDAGPTMSAEVGTR